MLPSKCHDVPVHPGDVLHFVTWGGGGWGDPLSRDPALVALEVRRGLVTASGARSYGVVVSASGSLDADSTAALRDEMRAGRPSSLPVFDMGPDLDTILARCEEETGLPAPTKPVWT
jgi:N-methylhydantoinase B